MSLCLAADSLGAKCTGETVYAVAKDKVDHVITLDDESILTAQRTLWTRHHLASEAGGAAAFAALLSGAYKPQKDERVGLILCGSNVDLDKLAHLTTA